MSDLLAHEDLAPKILSNLTRSPELGEMLAMGILYHVEPDRLTIQVMNTIDAASTFHIAHILVEGSVRKFAELENGIGEALVDQLQQWSRYLPKR